MLSNTILALTLAAAGASTFASPIPVARDGSHSGLIQYTDFSDATTACGEDYTNGYQNSPEGVYLIGVDGGSFGDGELCGQTIAITAPNGKSASGLVVDSCGDGCGDGGLLVTPELFKKFYSLGKGQFTGSWDIETDQTSSSDDSSSHNRRDDGAQTYDGQASYTNFSGSETACGGSYDDSDNVVGIDGNIFGNGDAACGATVSISAPNGQTHTATVVDSCDGCGDGAINLSTSLFEQFYNLDKGVFEATWKFI